MKHAGTCLSFAMLGLLVAACAGGPAGAPPSTGQPSGVGPNATDNGSSAASPAADACALLTTAEIGAITSSKASDGEPRRTGEDSICRWTLSSGPADYVEVTITPTGGRDKFDYYANDYYEVPPEHVPGLGEDAVKTGTIPGGSFYVVSGDKLLTVRFSLPMSVEDPYELAQLLAENATSRL